MKDRWLNIDYGDDELRPYCEPTRALDERRIGKACHLLCSLLHLALLTPPSLDDDEDDEDLECY